MKILIVHTTDEAALLAEIASAYPEFIAKDDAGNVIGFKTAYAAAIRSGSEMVAKIKVTEGPLDGVTGLPHIDDVMALTSLDVLAEAPAYGGQDAFDALDAAGLATVEAVAPPLETLDPETGDVLYTVPTRDRLGAFA